MYSVSRTTRCDQKITVIFLFFQKAIIYLSITILVPCKVNPLRYNTLIPAFFPILETLLKRAFCCRQQLMSRFFFYLLNHSKTLCFHQCLGKRKKSAGSKFDEHGGWGIITVLFLAKNSRTSINVWAGALSCCKIQDWFFHNSLHYWQIASCNRRIPSR